MLLLNREFVEDWLLSAEKGRIFIKRDLAMDIGTDSRLIAYKVFILYKFRYYNLMLFVFEDS